VAGKTRRREQVELARNVDGTDVLQMNTVKAEVQQEYVNFMFRYLKTQ